MPTLKFSAPALFCALSLPLALSACGEAASSPNPEVKARLVEPQMVLARLRTAEALAATPELEPSRKVADYYARRTGAAEAEDSPEGAKPADPSAEAEAAAEAGDWPPPGYGRFSPQSLPVPPGGVASTRLFAPDPAAFSDAAMAGLADPRPTLPQGFGQSQPGGFMRSDPAPASAAAFADPATPTPMGVAAVNAAGRDPFQDFLEALHKARSGSDLREAAEVLASEATAPAALTLAGSFEDESPDVAVAIYDALWRVRNLPEAARHMGVAARDGRGVAQDRTAAAAYFREAVAFGDLQARRLLADLDSSAARR